jgi:hypothetical protein
MKNKTLNKIIVVVFFLFQFSGAAVASIITLDNIPLDFRSQNLPSYSEGLFTVSASCTDCLNVFSTTEPNAGYGISTDAAGWGASERFLETWNTDVIFTLSKTAGSTFNFWGFDIGWFDNDIFNANWTVRAFDAMGDLVATDLYIGSGHFDFAYINVSAIEIQNNGGFSSFDNLRVTIPAPPVLLLFIAGLLGLGLNNRRN